MPWHVALSGATSQAATLEAMAGVKNENAERDGVQNPPAPVCIHLHEPLQVAEVLMAPQRASWAWTRHTGLAEDEAPTAGQFATREYRLEPTLQPVVPPTQMQSELAWQVCWLAISHASTLDATEALKNAKASREAMEKELNAMTVEVFPGATEPKLVKLSEVNLMR